MSNKLLTIKDLRYLFRDTVLAIMGTDIPKKNVRLDYPKDGMPGYDNENDYIFINAKIHPGDRFGDLRDDVVLSVDIAAGDRQEETWYTRIVGVDFFISSPNSQMIADKIRWGLLIDQYRINLIQQEVFPVLPLSQPRWAPANFNGQYWDRTDLSTEWNVATRRGRTQTLIKGVDIEIHDEHGLERVIEIEE